MDTKEKNRNRMAIYRSNKKSENKELFLEKQRLEKQKYRQKTKLDTAHPKMENDIFNKSIQNLSLINLVNREAPKVNKETLIKYIKNIARLYKAISNETFNGDITFLYNFDLVNEFIENKYDKLSTKISYYSSIIGYLKRVGIDEDLIKQYQKINKKLKNKLIKEIDKNELTKIQRENYVPWTDILDNRNISNLNPTDELLYSLYTLIPPRRLKDFQYMKIIFNNTKNLSKNYNYLIFKNNKPDKLIFYNYKTVKHYNQFLINLKSKDLLPYVNITELNKVIINYIKLVNPQNGDLLFPNSDNNIDTSFSNRVSQLFSTDNKHQSVNSLRHSFINFYNNHSLPLRIIKKLNALMSHSTLESLEYIKR